MKKRWFLALLILVIAPPALADGLDVALGKALFERRWVQAPASTKSADGLGPLFNAHACATCHKGGGPARFVINEQGVGALGLVVRLTSRQGAPDPYYGRQVQERAVPGLLPEARILPRLVPEATSLGLERMQVDLHLTGPALATGIAKEIRVAPSLAGRGLIASVEERAIKALADPEDSDGDGVSGRVRLVADGKGAPTLGRFGLKAAGASLATQVAAAASLDMGLSSPAHRTPHGDCTGRQEACLARAGADANEVTDEMVRLIAAFAGSLGQPSAEESTKGSAAFTRAGCAACHVPSLPAATGGRASIFSDLLLHDLGPGLAAVFGEDGADASEWRTAPLIDLDSRGGMRRYLHDGRAGSVEAAILWHDGEAAQARRRFLTLAREERAALLKFVEGL